MDGFEVLFWREFCQRGLHCFGFMNETGMPSIEDHALFRLLESLEFQSWQDWMLLELKHRGLHRPWDGIARRPHGMTDAQWQDLKES